MAGQPFAQIDAFTDKPFGGNPAAVLLLPAPRDASWMLLVAREMNLAETAFLVPRGAEFDLRWFTPTLEVDLCGHATLASAHLLWEDRHLPSGAVARFHTRSGILGARAEGEWIWLDMPAKPVTPIDCPPGLSSILGAPIRFTGTNDLGYLVVEVDSDDVVRGLRPDLGRIAALPARGVVVTARSSTAGRDFVSRFFAPAMGVPEDPVTGSAHCSLAPFWADKLGRTELCGYQASERGGEVRLRLDGDRAHLGGRAVTVLRGTLLAE
ncbi:MAG TPA: PhzF family phenazine biosynthesis protein [Gemmatimonadales bacterium]|jgi:predicted PhzF superfamily epimerase YddE/YHI9|nr:PhzF family phenazine biosynthesis protein [Gemmatimonadales bacterium]